MTINGPAPMLLGFFMNAAIDQQCEKYIKENGLEKEVEEKIASLKEILETGSKEDIETRTKELSDTLSKVGEAMYKEQQPDASEPNSEEKKDEPKEAKEGETVEGEVVDDGGDGK